jgi:hypothetical protein
MMLTEQARRVRVVQDYWTSSLMKLITSGTDDPRMTPLRESSKNAFYWLRELCLNRSPAA